jgi:multisubunit Na+/H+ antiporter MnhB subunit
LTLFLPIPLGPLGLCAVAPSHVATTLTIVWTGLVALCVAAAPLAALGRGEAGALAVLEVCATLMAGGIWLYLTFFSLCPHSTAMVLLAVAAAGVLPYLAFGALVLRSDEGASRVLGLPLAIVVGFVLSLIALALLGGGAHYCES